VGLSQGSIYNEFAGVEEIVYLKKIDFFGNIKKKIL